MAHVMRVDDLITYLYLNSTPVGNGADNKRRSDVQLVQFFLGRFFEHHPELFKHLPKTKNGGATVGIDGQVGEQTIQAIWTFQKYYQDIVYQDGRVSVAHTKYVDDTGKGFTIVLLNQWFFRTHGNADWNGKLRDHPTIVAYAPELQWELTYGEVNANWGT